MDSGAADLPCELRAKAGSLEDVAGLMQHSAMLMAHRAADLHLQVQQLKWFFVRTRKLCLLRDSQKKFVMFKMNLHRFSRGVLLLQLYIKIN